MKFISMGNGEAVFICNHNVPYLFDVICNKCEEKLKNIDDLEDVNELN